MTANSNFQVAAWRPDRIDTGETMKSTTLSSTVAIACALGLAACGGGSGNLLLGGAVIGLTKPGLVLQNNGADDLVVPAGTTQFAFAQLLKSDTAFEVKVKTQPSAANCTIANGKGKTGAYNVTSVIVTCVTNTYALGGTVEGLHSGGLIVNNGSERQEIASGASSFTMTLLKADGSYSSGKVADGAPYGLTIYQQPAGQTCSILNATGTMGSADVTNVKIQCV
jgi:hypothetical protein